MLISRRELYQIWKDGWVIVLRYVHFNIFLLILHMLLVGPIRILDEEIGIPWYLMVPLGLYVLMITPYIFYLAAKWSKRWLEVSAEKPKDISEAHL